MPFGKDFLYNATKLLDVKSVDGDFEFVDGLVREALKLVGERRIGIINPNQSVDIYLHGSYANATNIYFPSTAEICVELKIPPYDYQISNDYYILHNLSYTAQMFRTDLRECIDVVLARNVRGATVKCGEGDKCITIPQHGNLKHAVEIMPAVSFRFNEGSSAHFDGVVVYDKSVGQEIATFPKIHQTNGQNKDIRTDGNFRKTVRLFKTLTAIAARENPNDEFLNFRERGYFIECLLFNVPDSIFKSVDMGEIFLKVINYLMHADITNFVCQNLVWHLFGTARELWRPSSATKFLRQLKTLYVGFDVGRTELAMGD